MASKTTTLTRLFAATLLIIFFAFSPARAVEIPPTPTAHYYGDADGNVSINLSDIAQHTAYSSFRPCTYDTLQPQTGGQYWNTCDVDGNRSCNLSDIAILNSYTSFKPVSLGGDPWVLENVNLPLTGNAPNTWIPFNINLYMTYSGAPSGRPGISVIAEIDPTSPGHGELSGRSCTPAVGTRDQFAAPGAQCALALTITDWQPGQEGLGLTESGTYGFRVWNNGDGDLKIDFHIEELTGMDIPLVGLSQTISFAPAATVWYVDDTAPGPVHDGTSWATAFLTLQEGIDAASSGEQVWVAQGSYPRITMKDGVDIYGGFAGTEISLSERGSPPAIYSIIYGENIYTPVFGASNTRLDGFSIGSGGDSGYIYYNGSNVVLAYCDFSANYTHLSGGSIYIGNVNNMEILHCNIDGEAVLAGGGIYNGGSSIIIRDSSISGLEYDPTGMTGNGGGAIYNNGSMEIYDSSISGNMENSYGGGGAIYNTGNLLIDNCTISGLSYSSGGAIYALGFAAVTNVYNTVFANCEGSMTGGAVCDSSGAGTYINCEFTGNTGAFMGGGAYSNGTFINCVFGNNVAGYGGGLYGDATLINCTVSGNNALGTGGGIYNSSGAPITNSIIWGNTDSSGPSNIYYDTLPPVVEYSDIGGGFAGVGNIDADPMFVSATDFHIQSGSPCENTGTSSGAPIDDIEGNPRPMGGAYDMGAYEISGLVACEDGVDNDGDTLTDYPDDPDCDSLSDTSEYLITACNDGIDNDGDTLADYPDDPGCLSATDTSEYGSNECDDGIDNDGDTAIDANDTACFGYLTGLSETGECEDGIDNDGDTMIDWPDDGQCTSSSTSIEGMFFIALGQYHTCTSANSAKCWGYNHYGQLGNGTFYYRSVPDNVLMLSGVQQIVSGYSVTCAVVTGGVAKCWGDNSNGKLGDGGACGLGCSLPVDVLGIGSPVSMVATGYYHTCALTTSGGVKCWGLNQYGQLGDNQTCGTGECLSPVDVVGLTSGVIAIEAGYNHTCALTSSHGVKCWGQNDYGELGDGRTCGTSPNYICPAPVDVTGLTSGVEAISAGNSHTCVITSSGGVKCWGANGNGQLGNNSTNSSYVPVDVVGLSSGASSVAAGSSHSCAVVDGGVKCWGLNNYGQLGDGQACSTSYCRTPVDVSGLTNGATGVSAGQYHTCALMNSGAVKCWGSNMYGQLGDNQACGTGICSVPQDVYWQ